MWGTALTPFHSWASPKAEARCLCNRPPCKHITPKRNLEHTRNTTKTMETLPKQNPNLSGKWAMPGQRLPTSQAERWRLFFGDDIILLYNYIYYTVFTKCKHGLRYHKSHHLDLGPMKIESLFEQRLAMLSVTDTNKQPLWASLRGGLLHITCSKLLIYLILRSEMWSFNIPFLKRFCKDHNNLIIASQSTVYLKKMPSYKTLFASLNCTQELKLKLKLKKKGSDQLNSHCPTSPLTTLLTIVLRSQICLCHRYNTMSYIISVNRSTTLKCIWPSKTVKLRERWLCRRSREKGRKKSI